NDTAAVLGHFSDQKPPISENYRLKNFSTFVKSDAGVEPGLAYNIVLNTEPFRSGVDSACCFHWHFSILPSLARAAGFEWGTGLHINPISPEQAAKRLREA
ncbi:MAG: hypothetical protein FWE95_05710, partial [Planctomycetaceae bacterium]|nr:hypothetical protein [Planctomycetaceae bacterium]